MPDTEGGDRGPAAVPPPEEDGPVGWVGPRIKGRRTKHGVTVTGPSPASPYYRAEWRTPPHNQRHFSSLGTNYHSAGAKAEELDRLRALMDTTPADLPIEELAAAWIADLTLVWSPRHAADQARHVEEWVCEWVGDLEVAKLDRAMVRYLLAKPTAPSARRQLRALLGGMLSWGFANNWLTEPRAVLLPPAPRTAKRRAGRAVGESRLHIDENLIPSPDDCRRLAEAARDVGGAKHGQQWWLMVAVAASTGVRQGELFALRPSDVDLRAGSLHVERQLTRVIGLKPAETPPKWGMVRTTVLPAKTLWGEPLHAPLAEYMKGKDAGALLFPNSRGAWIHASNWGRRVLKPARETAKWRPEWSFHSTRHSFCSALVARGTAPQDVSSAAGHSSSATTLSMYTSPTRGVVGRLNDAFS
jgi:integrase